MAKSPCKLELTDRHVIEHKLLTALNDASRVAVLLEEKDLLVLINALESEGGKKSREFAADLCQLRKEAFGR